jgi:uncharacterized cupin superfamily protein
MDISVRKPAAEELDALGAAEWPIWSCQPSEFDWNYSEKETCYILEGTAEVETADGTVRFGAGDLVVFPEGLSCRWKVEEKIRKRYRFG